MDKVIMLRIHITNRVRRTCVNKVHVIALKSPI